MFAQNKKYSLVLTVFLLLMVLPCISAAGVVQYSQDGQNLSPDRLLLSDYTVTSERPELYPGDTLELSYVLTSEGFYDMLISLPKGLYFTALDPDGQEVTVGGAFTGQFISPGDSIIMKARLTVDKPGTWKIWPSYNVQSRNGIVRYNPEEWNAAEIYIDEEYVPLPDLTIIEAGMAGSGENGNEKRFYYVVENNGPLGANATISRIIVNDAEAGIENPVGMLPSGESQKVFFTLSDVSKGDKITIVLDSAGSTAELDEDNNDWSFAVNLKNDISASSETYSKAAVEEGSEESGGESENVVYYPATTTVSCDVTVQFIVLGIISVLMSVFSFALGYYYCQSKKCENELGWMYAKLKRLESGEDIDHSYIMAEEVPPEENIPEAEEILKGNSGEETPKEEAESSGDEEDAAPDQDSKEDTAGEPEGAVTDEKKE